MSKYYLIVLFCFTAVFSKAQTKKQPTPKKVATVVTAKETIIKTNNRDTLYFDLDNSIVLAPHNNVKSECYITATSGSITKLAPNFFILGDIKESSITISAFDKATNKLLETKKFVVAKQVLPF